MKTLKLIVALVLVADGISVAGEWEGRWSWSAYSGRITFHLTQDGDKVEGTYDFQGRNNLYNIKVVGTLKGNQLSLVIPSIAYGYIQATVSGNTMEGVYHGKTQVMTNFTVNRP